MNWLYFLTDGIYPSWSIFAKTYPYFSNLVEGKYVKRHTHIRKYIERALSANLKIWNNGETVTWLGY